MRSPAVDELLAPAERVTRVLWFALTTSIVIYVGIAAWIARSPSGAVAGAPPGLGWALVVAALSIGAAAWQLPRILLSDARLRAQLERGSDLDSLAAPAPGQPADPARRARVEALGADERALLAVAPLHLTTLMVRLMLNEAIAIFGLVLAMLERELAPLLPFAAAALVLNLAMFPRLDPLLERASRLLRSA